MNLLKKTSDLSATKNRNQLLRTTPNINIGGTPTVQRKTNQFKPPVRPVVTSHLRQKDPILNTRNRSAGKSDNSSVKSAHGDETKKRQFTPE